jgi:hypothetical protein
VVDHEAGSSRALKERSNQILVIVPCGRSKIWDRAPSLGPVPASEAYTGAPFIVNRQYAERFGNAWVVLSAKYGFIHPAFLILGPYEVSFKHPRTNPISEDRLREQVRTLQLERFPVVVGLGGKEYRAAITAAFAGSPVHLVFPFAGLPLGKSMQAAKMATASGNPGFGFTEGKHARSF